MNIEVSKLGQKSNPLLKRVRIVRGNIVDQDVDAVMTLIPEDLEYYGSLNQSILEAAGEKLDEFVLEHLYRPRAGDVYAVPGFDMKARHILFGIRPKWKNDFERHDKDLLHCMRRVLPLSQSMCLHSLAIPLLGGGKNGFPKARAARLILQGLQERMRNNLEDVRLMALDEREEEIWRERLAKIYS